MERKEGVDTAQRGRVGEEGGRPARGQVGGAVGGRGEREVDTVGRGGRLPAGCVPSRG